MCKHLVQMVHAVPAIFFLEAKRHRTTPFWQHPTLKPLDDDEALHPGSNKTGTVADHMLEGVHTATPGDIADEDDEGDDDDDDDDVEEEAFVSGAGGLTFDEAMEDKIKLITDFADGLRYQVQFRDQRMLKGLERNSASFFRMASACLMKERRMKTTRGATLSTWEKSTSEAMFYRTRSAGRRHMIRRPVCSCCFNV